MSPLSWIFLALVLAAGSAFAFWIYERRELPVRGARILALTRAISIGLILLLVWNPQFPGDVGPGSNASGLVLLDVSLSMSARTVDGETPWSRGAAQAARLAGPGGGLLLFGDDVVPTAVGELDGWEPEAAASRLLPALRTAAESGARAVTVVSDRRLQDADLGAFQAGLGLDVRFETVESDVTNAGVAEFRTPNQAGRESGFEVEVAVFGESAPASDSALVEVREEGRAVASASVEVPGPGRVVRLTLGLPAPGRDGLVRYTAAVVLDGDGFSPDNERARYVRVDAQATGLTLLSLRPDWEPRHVLPVLEEVTGLPVRGYLQVSGPRYLPMALGEDGGNEVGEAELRRILASSELLVLHGVDESAPPWLVDLAQSAHRLLLFPMDRIGASFLGIAAGSGLQGEWYVASELPPSPVAREFAGLDLSVLPPLTSLQPLTTAPDGLVPLQVRLGGRGPSEAALVLGAEDDRRWGVVLAAGFWRWAFRAGAPRRAYRSLWAGVADWLLANEPLVAGSGVRPTDLVLPRGSIVDWRAPGLADTDVSLRISRADTLVVDSTVTVGADDAFRILQLEPAAYTFEASSVEGDELGAGRFDIEAYTDELFLPPRADDALAGDDSEGAVGRDREGRPLRTHPAPFVLILGLLCGEWIGRRRRGLR